MSDATPSININAIPNPVSFMLDQSELEVLALHYFTESLIYDFMQFRMPGEPISSQDWYDDQVAAIRLDQIAEVLGHDKMNVLHNQAHSDFKRRYDIADEEWAEFTSDPARPVDASVENL
jgi:hypothetical protein